MYTVFSWNASPVRIDSMIAGVPPSSRASISDVYACDSRDTCNESKYEVMRKDVIVQAQYHFF